LLTILGELKFSGNTHQRP